VVLRTGPAVLETPAPTSRAVAPGNPRPMSRSGLCVGRASSVRPAARSSAEGACARSATWPRCGTPRARLTATVRVGRQCAGCVCEPLRAIDHTDERVVEVSVERPDWTTRGSDGRVCCKTGRGHAGVASMQQCRLSAGYPRSTCSGSRRPPMWAPRPVRYAGPSRCRTAASARNRRLRQQGPAAGGTVRMGSWFV
jgi:hypothetical protein